MTRFISRQVVSTRSPKIKVDAGLSVGRYRFQLTVIDAAGNRSKPARLTVTIKPVTR